jgi:seryl-tRNA synthetase
MSRDYDHIIKEITKSNKEIHNIDKTLSKDIESLSRNIKFIETKLAKIDSTLEKVFDLLTAITVFIEEAEEEDVDEDVEDWTPYDERNFAYEDDEENEDSDYGLENDWEDHNDEN